MISCTLHNSLANQVFMAATLMAHAWRNNDTYALPAQTLHPHLWRRCLPHLPTLPENFHPSMVYQEPAHHYHELPYQDRMVLSGYFQSYKYFDDYRERVLDELAFPYNPEPGVVAVHYRAYKGEDPNKFLPVSAAYLMEAMNHTCLYFGKSMRFRFYSDDISWCKDFCDKHGWDAEFSEGRTAEEDLASGSSCEHQIIANSTYGWMMGYLNRNPNKIVIAPRHDTWYQHELSHFATHDLIPDQWIQL